MKSFVYCAICCLIFVVSSCSSRVKTKVNTFRLDGVTLGQGTIRVIPGNDAQAASLEYAYYSAHLGKVLEDLGYSFIAEDEPTDYTAVLNYSVKETESTNTSPFRGLLFPSYERNLRPSVVVVEDGGRRPAYERNLQLVIARFEGKRVYEVSGVSRGRCGTLSVVFEEMLQAMVTEFPANNGSLNSFIVAGDTSC